MASHTEDPKRRVYNAHRQAAIGIDAVGMPLGMWVGNGDYAKFSQEARDRAGQRALAELDAALAEMREVRDQLAAAVAVE